MANMKFKIGDKVRIVKNIWDTTFKREDVGIGEVHTVIGVFPYLRYPYALDGLTLYQWHEDELELVNNDKIVITNDGKTTIATLYHDDGTKKTATAEHRDFFDGAMLALRRLFGKEDVGIMKKTEIPKYYSGKVVCVKSEYTRDFTVGKVYEFVDGVVKDNRGASRYVGHPIKDPSEIKGIWNFIPFVE